MRALTEAEARLIRAMLSDPGQSERELLTATQLPRSTYHAVRKRSYDEGWLHDRFLPHPEAYGLGAVTFAVAHPFAESAVPLMTRWSQLTEGVVLWGGARLIFGTFFHRNLSEASHLVDSLVDAPMRSRSFFLSTEISEASVPVFFDFEGVWSHLAELPGVSQYPRSIVPPLPPGRRPPDNGPSEGLVRATRNLILRPVIAEHEGRPGHFLGFLGLTRPERRLLEDGWVYRRVIPDFARLPSYQSRAADQVVFVRGQLRPGAEPGTLFQALTERCQVFPFLLAHDRATVLLGTVGQTTPSPRSPRSNGKSPGRASVLGTLEDSLHQIEVDSEWVRNLAPIVDHRYDRLFPDDRVRAAGARAA